MIRIGDEDDDDEFANRRIVDTPGFAIARPIRCSSPRSMSHRGHRESMNGKIEALCRKIIGNRDFRIDGGSMENGDLRSRDDEQ